MSYINANLVLPKELIKEIQKYLDGINLYVSKVPEAKSACSSYKLEIYRRNQEICGRFLQGEKVSELAGAYFLSEKSIYRILGGMKKIMTFGREKSFRGFSRSFRFPHKNDNRKSSCYHLYCITLNAA